MAKIKVRPKEETHNRYAESSVISAIRLRRYWLSQGESEQVAVERAVRQATGMAASSGVPLEKLIELFDEIGSASVAFKEMVRTMIRESKETSASRGDNKRARSST